MKDDLTLRRYQIAAKNEVARLFDENGLRKFLLEMATGSGKTLLCCRRGLRPSGRGTAELAPTGGVPLPGPVRTRMHEAVMAA